MPKRVFFAVLNMGLGHATRSLPLIRAFKRRNWEVLLGSNGRARDFLIAEEPDLEHIETPDYRVRYSNSRLGLFPTLAMQLPGIRRQIRSETEHCKQIVYHQRPDLIVSDHCYGIFHPQCPSIFITHQIYFSMPAGFSVLRSLPAAVNQSFHRHFSRVVIPDLPAENGGILSGELSQLPSKNAQRYRYCGPLASIRRLEIPLQLDVLVSISGPEPQRTRLEEIVLADIRKVPGKKAVALGKSESTAPPIVEGDLTIYPHLSREQMEFCMNGAKLVVSRPGYSTLMELAELRKKALLVPTPGQTEQEYLARSLSKRKFFHSVNQEKLDLWRDLALAADRPGYTGEFVTENSVKSFFKVVSELLASGNGDKNKS